MGLIFNDQEGYCRIKTFGLNTSDKEILGIPNIHPADGFLISTFTGERAQHILLDAGKKGQGEQIIIPYLLEQEIDRIDYLILSHIHYDHFGGIIDLLNHPNITVGQLIYAPISGDTLDNCSIGVVNIPLWKELQSLIDEKQQAVTLLGIEHIGDIIGMDGELYFDIISTPNELLMQKGKKANLNELNLVLKMNYRQFTALFPGDCGEAQTNDIIRSDQD